MADIEDDVEFDEMLEFVMNQWRNVRQRKMAKHTTAHGPTQITRSGSSSELKLEFGISSSDNDEEEGEDALEYVKEARPRIQLNPKAKKVGAPRKLKKVITAGERMDRKWYDQAQRGRKQAGEVTLSDLLDALNRDQPSLLETQRRLAGVIVKFKDADNKKPKFRMMKNPVTITDPFYILPPKLLAACMKILPVSNTASSAIDVDASQGSTNVTTSSAKETVVIKDVGNFSREQIETFTKVQILKEAVELGFDMHKWLTCAGIPALPAEYHEMANKVAAGVLDTYPYKAIEGLPNMPDFVYSMLYRATPPTWLTDAAIRALCFRLADDFPSCRFAGFQAAEAFKKRTRTSDGGRVDQVIRERVFQQVSESGVDSVLIPVNFHSAHWCCIVIKVSARRILYYDPLNQAPYLSAANAIANQLKISGLQEYDLVQQNNPIQFDAFSCGVYVCWMFIRLVAGGPPQDMSANALPRRRFELFYYLLTGRLIPFEGLKMHPDDEEEKVPPPIVAAEDNHEDDVPPTQVAQ